MENPNNQFTPPEASEQTPFYKTTWFILLTTFCICCPVGLFLMWKYKKFHIGVRIAFTSVFSLSVVFFTALAVANAIGGSSRKASSSVYPKYSMETTANDLFETEEKTATIATRPAIEETTTAAIIPETTMDAETSASANQNVYDVTLDELLSSYSADYEKADVLYKGKTLRFTGTVTYVDRNYDNTIILDFKVGDKDYFVNTVTSYFYDDTEMAKADKVKVGDTVTLVGVCDGSVITLVLSDCKIQ
jgi:hypothetical protein